MPYATKFRDVDFPPQTWEPPRLDANSLRSYGAAFYKQYAGNANREQLGRFIDMTCSVFVGAAKNEKLPLKPRTVQYFLQGVQRAAKSADDATTVEYISRKLSDI